MPTETTDGRIYTVVDVWRGIAVGAHSFHRAKDAIACLRRLRRGRDLQEDCVKVLVCYPVQKEARAGRERGAGGLGLGWSSEREDSFVEEIVP